MEKSVKRLLENSSDSFAEDGTRFLESGGLGPNKIASELKEILTKKNGFFAYDKALHFFPIFELRKSPGLVEWNDFTLWKHMYGPDMERAICFAQDLFGNQFCIVDDGILIFDPETGEMEMMARNFEDWAEVMLGDIDFWTGQSLSKEWQSIYGTIEFGCRLIPKIPFVLGGEFSISNLRECSCLEGMLFRGQISSQIKGLADGEKVEFELR